MDKTKKHKDVQLTKAVVKLTAFTLSLTIVVTMTVFVTIDIMNHHYADAIFDATLGGVYIIGGYSTYLITIRNGRNENNIR